MAKNKNTNKKTPKKGVSAAGMGRTKRRRLNTKNKKGILKQKLCRGFGNLSPTQISTPKGVQTPKNPISKIVFLTPKNIAPPIVTDQSSFDSAENTPIFRQAVQRNPKVMEIFRNVHMVPNKGLKRGRTAKMKHSKTGSMEMNIGNSQINDKKKIMKKVCVDVGKSEGCVNEKDDSIDNLNTPAPPQWKGPLNTPNSPELKRSLNTPVGVNSSDNATIVIEDDKKNDTHEGLGEEMLDIFTDKAFGNPVPATPNTLVNQEAPFKVALKQSSDETEKDESDCVIVIDDTIEDAIEDDELEIIAEVSGNKNENSFPIPMTTSNIQDVTERYQATSQDFIGFRIDTKPGGQTVGQRGQALGQRGQTVEQLKQKWREMRKKVPGRKMFGKHQVKFGKHQVNTMPLPKLAAGPSRLTSNLMVGPSLLTSNERAGAFNNERAGASQLAKKAKAADRFDREGQRGSRANRPGDWICTCGNYNFQWRTSCNNCRNLRGEKNDEVSRPKSPILVQNSGPTIFVPESGETAKSGLRPIVIDGSNVAMAHGKRTFSSRGIEICIQYFKKRGHTTILAFLPQFRQGHDPELFGKLEKDGNIVFTPSRKIGDKRVTSYDDRMFIEYAHEHGGVIISRDNFRDILSEKPEWRETIEERLLMPTWAGDSLMFPSDPLGAGGPALDELLKF